MCGDAAAQTSRAADRVVRLQQVEEALTRRGVRLVLEQELGQVVGDASAVVAAVQCGEVTAQQVVTVGAANAVPDDPADLVEADPGLADVDRRWVVGCAVAAIAVAVAVVVALGEVDELRAEVAQVAESVTVGVGLGRVDGLRAVVVAVRNLVAVGVVGRADQIQHRRVGDIPIVLVGEQRACQFDQREAPVAGFQRRSGLMGHPRHAAAGGERVGLEQEIGPRRPREQSADGDEAERYFVGIDDLHVDLDPRVAVLEPDPVHMHAEEARTMLDLRAPVGCRVPRRSVPGQVIDGEAVRRVGEVAARRMGQTGQTRAAGGRAERDGGLLGCQQRARDQHAGLDAAQLVEHEDVDLQLAGLLLGHGECVDVNRIPADQRERGQGVLGVDPPPAEGVVAAGEILLGGTDLVLCGVAEDVANLLVGQRRILGPEQGRQAGGAGCRGRAAAEVAGVVVPGVVLGGEYRASRGHHIESRRLVGTRIPVVGVLAPSGGEYLGVRRRIVQRRRAVVAVAADQDHTGLVGHAGRGGESRVVRVADQAEVGDVGADRRRVQHALDQRGRGAEVAVVEHLDRYQAGTPVAAGDGPGVVCAGAEQAGDLRAMAVVVLGVRVVEADVVAAGADPSDELGVVAFDAGVEDHRECLGDTHRTVPGFGEIHVGIGQSTELPGVVDSPLIGVVRVVGDDLGSGPASAAELVQLGLFHPRVPAELLGVVPRGGLAGELDDVGAVEAVLADQRRCRVGPGEP